MEALEKFITYLRSVDMSENTVISYGTDVREFLDFILSKGKDIHDVDHEMLLQFLGYLTDRGLRSSTRRRKPRSRDLDKSIPATGRRTTSHLRYGASGPRSREGRTLYAANAVLYPE